MEKTIANLFEESLEPLDVWEGVSWMNKPVNWSRVCGIDAERLLHPHNFQLSVSNSPYLYGIEVEIEGLGELEGSSWKLPPGWMGKKDGSLRNHGYEFVSYPATIAVLSRSLVVLFSDLRKHFPSADFSWRTSIHVHSNVRDLTSEQFYKMVLLYLLFEGSFFRYADVKRKDSIFCVPLLDIPSIIYPIVSGWRDSRHRTVNPGSLLGEWHKYAALGVFQLKTFGTLEFRHMPGTWDWGKIIGWLCLIDQLKQSAISISSEKLEETILKINTLSHYGIFREEVFQKYSHLFSIPNFEMDIAHGAASLKEKLFYTPIKNLINPRNNGLLSLSKKLKERDVKNQYLKKEQLLREWLGEKTQNPTLQNSNKSHVLEIPPGATFSVARDPKKPEHRKTISSKPIAFKPIYPSSLDEVFNLYSQELLKPKIKKLPKQEDFNDKDLILHNDYYDAQSDER